jgi:hypothetical protein
MKNQIDSILKQKDKPDQKIKVYKELLSKIVTKNEDLKKNQRNFKISFSNEYQ